VSARIHPTAMVDPTAQLGADVEVGAYCMIGPDVEIGDRCRLVAHVFVERHVSMGADNTVYPYAVLGTPGQDTSYKGEPTKLIIGARNIIREHASMHRGTVRGRNETRVGNDNFFMAQSHVAHDCIVGDKVTLAHGATLGGHVVVEDMVIMGGLSAMHQFGRIGRGAFVGGLAAVVEDVIPYGSVFGNHAHLGGLNVIGLKRRGYTKSQLLRLRAGVNFLFDGDGTFQERLEQAGRDYADLPEMVEILTFIQADSKRPICRPAKA
jgi:UDP-N-acetylglucosamine acyltransferase